MTQSSAHGKIVASRFQEALWLRGRHPQTLFSSLPWPHGPRPSVVREVLELPDGDVTVVDRLADDGRERPPDAPLLIILHGLEGSGESKYARYMLEATARRGWHGAVLHSRDCGEHRNRLPRRYHAGETEDLRYFVQHCRSQGFAGPMVAVGYSLGGNALLKYLGEDGDQAELAAAVAVCVPLDLQRCADALETGFARIYQRHLLKRMKKAVRAKFEADTKAFDWQQAMAAKTFSEFDDAVTAPLHGYRGKDHYYQSCSSVHFLIDIERPTLIINARDDPFMLPDMLPEADALAAAVTLEISETGGHVGFVGGGWPWRPTHYLPQRALTFLAGSLEE